MKILGIGVDIIQNKRLKNLIKKKIFLSKTFSINEIKFSKKKSMKLNYYAKRFAAKESFAKSIGTGFRENLKFKDIEILNDKKGKPFYFKNKKISAIIYKRFKTRKYNIFLSISDEKDYSIAFTIIQKK
tara:strand:+ start:1315 stop:1701 length:387 start_codon:yes stop_codon:yes gene_type:complete